MTKASDLTEEILVEHIAAQRWYGSKDREVAHAAVVDCAELPGAVIALVEVRFPEGTHDTYQLVAGDTLDGLEEPSVARELVQRIRAGVAQRTRAGGTIFFQAVEGFAGLGAELVAPRVIEGEQSNTSVVFDDQLILKVYRRLEAGINPELEMLRFLGEHGFENVPALHGWYAYHGRPAESTLGILQEFVADGLDGWELALDQLADVPDRFLGRLRRLGEVTGAMHTTLASDPSDPNFAAEEPSLEALGLLTATVDEEIQRVFLDLPDDIDALEPIRARGEEIRERLRQRTHTGAAGRIIRCHGDLHLGQTLLSPSDEWVILDFEGEPARSLPERRRKRSPLRDVAGMLRSFAYAANALELLRGTEAPTGWGERARAEFLAGYQQTVDATIVPPGPEAFERLLSVFELEKAVYELRYELSMRPDWVPIPVAGILRILEEEPVTT
ncbi:MAG: maltokinase N-terminal cap-like domain-containing protein [Verrucomicrobiota bacterium]